MSLLFSAPRSNCSLALSLSHTRTHTHTHTHSPSLSYFLYPLFRRLQVQRAYSHFVAVQQDLAERLSASVNPDLSGSDSGSRSVSISVSRSAYNVYRHSRIGS